MAADLVVFALKLTVVDFEGTARRHWVEPFCRPDRDRSADLQYSTERASGPTRAKDTVAVRPERTFKDEATRTGSTCW